MFGLSKYLLTMQPTETQDADTNEPHGPRLVLITADGPAADPKGSPVEIIGSEPHASGGGFCLTALVG